MLIGNKDYSDNHTYVCGILNVTPDSFSDGGAYLKKDAALFHVEKMIDEGADIIDVGGQSTRPGFAEVSREEEAERVCHIVEEIKSRFNICVSIDTYRACVAKECLLLGADMINDVSGLGDPDMAATISRAGASVCIMDDGRGNAYLSYQKENGGLDALNEERFVNALNEDIVFKVNRALESGIGKDRIMIDPGIGFKANPDENSVIIKYIDRFKMTGYPVLLGCSRKSFIGNILNVPVDERLEGTLAVTAYACMKGVNFVRVHDVKENVRVIKMIESIIR